MPQWSIGNHITLSFNHDKLEGIAGQALELVFNLAALSEGEKASASSDFIVNRQAGTPPNQMVCLTVSVSHAFPREEQSFVLLD